MNVTVRNSRWNYMLGTVFLSLGTYAAFSSDIGDRRILAPCWIVLGVLRLAYAIIPYSRLNNERLIIQNLILTRSIFLRDIVRLESDPLHYYGGRKIVIHEVSGRKTELSPPDPNKFIGELSFLLTDSVPGRSTGNPPPLWGGVPSRPISSYYPLRKWSLTGWMSMVYDAKTHMIRSNPHNKNQTITH